MQVDERTRLTAQFEDLIRRHGFNLIWIILHEAWLNTRRR
jgi:hypothetical protein